MPDDPNQDQKTMSQEPAAENPGTQSDTQEELERGANQRLLRFAALMVPGTLLLAWLLGHADARPILWIPTAILGLGWFSFMIYGYFRLEKDRHKSRRNLALGYITVIVLPYLIGGLLFTDCWKQVSEHLYSNLWNLITLVLLVLLYSGKFKGYHKKEIFK